jgi:hypothetical protein
MGSEAVCDRRAKSVLGFQKLRFNLERGTHQSDPGQVDI